MQSAVSLDERWSTGDALEDLAPRLGVAAPPDAEVDDMAAILHTLPLRERTIVDLRFRYELTQGEIAERVGCSQMHVCRLLRKALAQLRTLPEIYELAA